MFNLTVFHRNFMLCLKEQSLKNFLVDFVRAQEAECV